MIGLLLPVGYVFFVCLESIKNCERPLPFTKKFDYFRFSLCLSLASFLSWSNSIIRSLYSASERERESELSSKSIDRFLESSSSS